MKIKNITKNTFTEGLIIGIAVGIFAGLMFYFF